LATSALPAQVRAATGEAKFGITGDLPALQPSPSMTGSMPLVDEQSLSGVDFALPEYDDGDFSADMEPAPDPRQMSAAGERHADEIAKTLAETDVYVKYGLHQKAADHLRRVFALDPNNVEAHERLKDILISQGREQEAEAELLKLAELIAPSDPDRAEAYLRELLTMDGTHTGAFEIARRFRLRVSRMSSVSSEVEYQVSGPGSGGVEVELDDLDLLSAPVLAVSLPRSKRDSIDDFDPDELISGRVANGSPATRLPQPPRPYEPTDNFDLEFEPSPSQSTRQMTPEDVEALNQLPDDLDDSVIVDRPRHDRARDQALRAAVDRQLDDALSDDIDGAVAAELGTGVSYDLPFDPDEARAFDRAVAASAPKAETDAVYVSGFEETDMPPRPTARGGPAAAAFDDGLSISGTYDPFGTEAVQTPPFDPTVANVVDARIDADLAKPPRAESTVEDDLDEADFYAGQAMYVEAMDVLRGLLERYPNHRLIQTKLREVEALAAGEEPIEVGGESIEAEAGATDAIALDEIEEVNVDDLDDLPESAPVKKRRPTVMLEKPVDEGDAETHYDLGLAYKEMGLHDEAIKAFEKVLRSPQREVQCRLMIGMCKRDMGNPSEAIHQFKQGLHAEPSERERQSLYYEIGVTYESIGDFSEALYYFEMVTKRDPGFADAGARANALRARGMNPSDDDI
ncbi:MAG TPA: tetratricopeptide repeat protein, partial [Kofleriaceae bacterium]|nr:tetratricopeptide repeat protein [Kofleriaceae bacterium]